jgi:DNA-binding MarR family transcriptional regulator
MKEISDFVQMSPQKTSFLLQKLVKKKIIASVSDRTKTEITFLPDAAHIIKDFEMVEQDFDSVRFSSFSPEEQENYRAMTSQVQENIGEFLSRI